MNLVIDIGNSRSKFAIFHNNLLIDQKINDDFRNEDLKQLLSDHPSISQCIVSSVTNRKDEIVKYLESNNLPVIILSPDSIFPFKNNYVTKETLGFDRLAGIAGACFLYPGKDVLVIDAGTAITFDFKNKLEEFLGGNISPGLEMRFKALHYYTSKLPLLSSETSDTLMGISTKEAILNGVQNGLIFEIEGYIDEFLRKYQDLIVLLTGGASAFIADKIKRTCIVDPFLVLKGFNTILEYNRT